MKKYFLIFAFALILIPFASEARESEESCNIDFSFSPSVVEQGDGYTASWTSEGVQSGTMQYKCSDMSSWASLGDLYEFSTSYTADIIGTHSCDIIGQSLNGTECSAGDTITTIAPTCSASISWDKTSTAYGGSATETWQVSGADRVTGDCGGGEIGIGFGPQSYTFNNLTSDTTCTVRGYDNDVLACSASATVKVNPPPPPPTPLKINVNAPGGMSWKVVGPQTFTGTGNKELEAPAGTYTLYVTNGWNGRVVTSISPAQQQSLEAPPVPGVPAPPPPPPPTLTPTNPVEPDPDRPKPIEPVGPFDRMFFKSSPVRFLSYFLKSVNATEGSIAFTINTRLTKNPSGSLNVSSPTLTVGQSYSVTGTTNDSGNAFKYLNLFKKFTRLSNGQTGTAESTSWNAISTDQNGNFTHSSVFGCSGGDSSVFLDSDYSDQSYVVYDQGDGTGDTSPVVSMNKLCGLPFSIVSKNKSGADVPISWGISGVYANWDNTDSQYSNGLYSIRLDRGLNSFSAQLPPGYGSFKADLWLIAAGRGGGKQLRGSFNSFSIPFDLNTAGLQLEITWIEGVGPPGGESVYCVPASQEAEIGKEVVLYGEGGVSYSWNAPGGSPSSGSGDSFRTIYNSEGSKTVTISSGGGKPGNCTVNVSDPAVNPPPIPTVDLKINNFDSWTMNSGGSVPLSWTSTDADSCVASGGSPGWSSGSRPISGSWNTGNLNVPPNSYAYTIRCFNESGDDEDTAILTLIPPGEPTLNVNLNAVPAAGQSPLNSSLTATVSGTATGNISYYFWWNCSSNANTKAGVMADGCGDPSNPLFGQVIASTNENPKTIPHSYVGVVGATFVPKVVVERGAAASAQDKTNIAITDDGANSHLTCVNNSCVRVPGAGANTCTPEGSACVSGPGGQTHLECINNSCVSVPGAGSNNCSPVGAVCSSEPPIDPESACTFTSSPKLINRGGSSRLEWDCDPSVNSCSISQGIGSVSRSGTRTVQPAQTTRYTLTCNIGGSPVSWNASVNVFQVDEDVPQ